jgi:glycosyltransferase involved in cell wall biosynthesis
MRLHLELAHSFDPASWSDRHSAGLVPDRLPYGLQRLEDHGFELSVRPAGPQLLEGLDALSRRATGGLELVHAFRHSARRACDLACCWDERTGLAASLRSRLPAEPAVATGVIWLTDEAGPLTALGRGLARRALRRAAAVWTLSPPQLPILANEWGVDRHRLHFLRMGIDKDFWRPTGEDPEPGLIIGGGNDRHRDHAALVRAIAKVRRRRPSARLELATHQEVLLPAEVGVRHPSLSHTAMRDLYARAAIVAVAVQPNLHVSGMSVLLEAMACERPVVATDTPGMDEYVADGETGLLVPAGDEGALAGTIEGLLADPERGRELGRAGRQAVEARYSTETLSKGLTEILRAAAPG